MHFRLSILSLVLTTRSSLAQLGPAQLTAALIPGADATSPVATLDTSHVFGQTLALHPFGLTILTNTTHSLVSFNVSSTYKKIGWIACGFGTTMTDSSMVILWPDDSGKEWTISLRSTSGYQSPRVSSTSSSKMSVSPAFDILYDYSEMDSKRTIISFLRPSELPANQASFLNEKYLNLTRAAGQRIIFAASSERPYSMNVDELLDQHDERAFGAAAINLSKIFLVQPKTPTAGTGTGSTTNSSSTDGTDSTPTDSVGTVASGPEVIVTDYTHWDRIIFAHAGVAIATYVLVLPVGVLIARIGRHMGAQKWFIWHSTVQGYVAIPATIVTLALGVTAASIAPGPLDYHKAMGFVLFALVLAQAVFGYVSHTNPFDPVIHNTRPWYRVTHIFLGVSILIVGWIQVATGFKKYPLNVASIITIVGVSFFGLIYLVSLVELAVIRHREGRTWGKAMLGLGRNSASKQVKPWVGRMSTWGAPKPQDSYEPKVEGESGDLSAWR